MTPRQRYYFAAGVLAWAAWCTLGLPVRECLAAEALVLQQGDTKILKFEKMKRVWVADPAVIDVVVASYHELLVYTKSVGRTKLFVWDNIGRHEYSVEVRSVPAARQVVHELTSVLGRGIKYTIVDDRTILVEGEVATQAERERIARVVEAKADGIKILDLVTVRNSNLRPAEAHRVALEKLFPEQFRYSVLDDATLIIEGEVATLAEKQRVEKIIGAVRGVTVVDLVECLDSIKSPRQQRIESLKRALGPAYQYQVLEDNLLVVSGQADTPAERERVNKIVTAAAGDITVVNVVTTQEDTLSLAARYAQALAPVLGPQYKLTPVLDNGLTVEGVAANATEAARVKQVLELVPNTVKLVNLVTPGGLSAAERAVRMMQASLGDTCRVRMVGDELVLVEGTVSSQADRQRVDTVVAAAPEGVKVLNLVSLETAGLSPAGRYAHALRSLFGDQLDYREIDDSTLLIEGPLDAMTDKDRLDQIVQAIGGAAKILDFTFVRTEAGTVSRSEAQRRVEQLQTLLGAGISCRAIDDKTVAIEGEVDSPEAKERVDAVTRALGGRVTFINLVSLRKPALEDSDAAGKAQTLRALLGPRLTYRVIDDTTLAIEGQVANQEEKQQLETVLASMGTGTRFINLVTVGSDPSSLVTTTTARKCNALRTLLPASVTCRAVDDDTLAVEGTVANADEKARVDDALKAVAGTTRIINLVAVAKPARSLAEQKVDMLRPVLGNALSYRPLDDKTLLIEGEVANERELQRLEMILQPLAGTVNVINLVSVRSETGEAAPRSAAGRLSAMLPPILGGNLTYRVLGDTTLLIEGETETAADKERIEKIIESLSGSSCTVLSLLTVRPGPGALARSKADRRAELLSRILGDNVTCDAVDEGTVLVQGVAGDEAELKRMTDAIAQAAGDVKVINMIVPAQDAGGGTPAERGIAALRPALPEGVKALALDSKTILLTGIVPTSIEKGQVDKVAEMTVKSRNLNVLSLVLSQQEAKTPAARRIEGLRKIIGDKYNYIVWDEDTVLVEGYAATQQEAERLRKIIEAADKDWKVVDLITTVPGGLGDTGVEGEPGALLEQLSEALGADYRVTHLRGRKYIVEGQAPDEAAMARVNQVLQAYADVADIANLVSVAPPGAVPLVTKAEALRSVLGDQFQVRTLQGKAILVEGTVPSKQQAERARAIIAALGNDPPVVDLVTVVDPTKRQVLARVKVLDINRGTLKRLGPNWGQLAAGSAGGTVTFADQPFLIGVEGGLGSVSEIAANLDALKQTDQARVLSEPNLIVNEGEQASIVVGGEIPIPVPQMGVGATSISIEYREYGVVLRMKPVIMADGNTIRLDVEPEVSSIDPATQVVISGMSIPAFRTRKAKTVVDIPRGATLVIGGLLANEQSKVVRSIPFLSKLPIIGELFKHSEWKQGHTELVILVTPEILQGAAVEPPTP